MTTVTDPDRPPEDDLTGQQCGGSYRIVRRIGAGGMGEVWLARAGELDGKEAAVKVLHRAALTRPDLLRRFKIEARAIGGLSDQNVVHVWDAGKLADGRHYMIMEFCSGGSLASLLEKKNNLSLEDTFMFTAGVAQALAAAHAADVIHRDVKPDNILLVNQNGRVLAKLSDFGIAKLNYERLDAAFRGGTMGALGTPGFMAPEQLDPKNGIDHRADIFSLGCVIYRCLTGRTPYPDNNHYQYIDAIVRKVRFPRPRELRSEIPVELDNLIMDCLEHDPAKRVQTVVEVVRRFSRTLFNGQGLLQFFAPLLVEHATAPTAPTISASVGIAATQFANSVSESVNQERRSNLRKIVAAFFAGMLLAGIAAVVAGHSWAQPAPCGELADASATATSVVTTPAAEPRSIGVPVSPAPNLTPAPPTRITASTTPAHIAASTSASSAPTPTPAASIAAVSIDAGIDAPRITAASLDAREEAPHVGAVPDTRLDVRVKAPQPTPAATLSPSSPSTATDRALPSTSPDISSSKPVTSSTLATSPAPRPSAAAIDEAPKLTGELIVSVDPYAEVWLDGRSIGPTPISIRVRVGPHRLKLVNKDLEIEKSIAVTISADKPARIEQSW